MIAGLPLLPLLTAGVPEAVRPEAEHFQQTGGWQRDTQHVDVMGIVAGLHRDPR